MSVKSSNPQEHHVELQVCIFNPVLNPQIIQVGDGHRVIHSENMYVCPNFATHGEFWGMWADFAQLPYMLGLFGGVKPNFLDKNYKHIWANPFCTPLTPHSDFSGFCHFRQRAHNMWPISLLIKLQKATLGNAIFNLPKRLEWKLCVTFLLVVNKDVKFYLCICIYIYIYAVKLLSGPSFAISGVIIWAK